MQIWKNFYFVLILHLILGKVTKFLVKKLSTKEVISQKPLGGGGGNSAFRVKERVSLMVLLRCNFLQNAFKQGNYLQKASAINFKDMAARDLVIAM